MTTTWKGCATSPPRGSVWVADEASSSGTALQAAGCGGSHLVNAGVIRAGEQWTGESAAAAAPASATTAVRSGKLLIVDDEEDVSGVLDRLLSGTHTVTVVGDGKRALDELVPGDFDVALDDLDELESVVAQAIQLRDSRE